MDDQFERDQQAYAALVKEVGFDAIPLNDEKWRPLMSLLWRVAEKHQQRVYTFDMPACPDRLYQGLRGHPKRIVKAAGELQAELLNLYTREQLAEAKPCLTAGPPTSLWFEGVWTDKGGLRSRRN
jgi:hypothetical protein